MMLDSGADRPNQSGVPRPLQFGIGQLLEWTVICAAAFALVSLLVYNEAAMARVVGVMVGALFATDALRWLSLQQTACVVLRPTQALRAKKRRTMVIWLARVAARYVCVAMVVYGLFCCGFGSGGGLMTGYGATILALCIRPFADGAWPQPEALHWQFRPPGDPWQFIAIAIAPRSAEVPRVGGWLFRWITIPPAIVALVGMLVRKDASFAAITGAILGGVLPLDLWRLWWWRGNFRRGMRLQHGWAMTRWLAHRSARAPLLATLLAVPNESDLVFWVPAQLMALVGLGANEWTLWRIEQPPRSDDCKFIVPS
jgi:hypothetical protein